MPFARNWLPLTTVMASRAITADHPPQQQIRSLYFS